jgi:hypothetical protein
MKSLIVIAAALALTGCASKPAQVITKTEIQVFVPDRSMFYCQNVRRFPNPETLTDIEVAKLLIELHSKNTVCQKNMNAVYKTLEGAKAEADTNKEQPKK